MSGQLTGSEMTRCLELLQHRGPDVRDTFEDDQVILGHARLAIRDLEKRSNQPFVSASGGLILTYNGELYNTEALVKDLRVKHLRTTSDTEVLAEVIDQFQEAGVGRLNGIYAFGAYDKETKKLIVARDPMGIKPLYYYRDETCFIFSSEMKVVVELVRAASLCLTVSGPGMDEYLSLGYTLAPETIYAQVRMVKPGECLALTPEGVTSSPYDFDQLFDNRAVPPQTSESFEQTLSEALVRQSVANVPLGLFMSGGMDSSALLCLAKENGIELTPFIFKFENKNYDESAQARKICEKLGYPDYVVCENKFSAQNVIEAIEALDQPFADSSYLAYYQLTKEAKKHGKCFLGGDGADEILGGYHTYKMTTLASLVRQFDRQETLSRLFDRVTALTRNENRRYDTFQVFNRIAKVLPVAFPAQHLLWRTNVFPELKGKIYPAGANIGEHLNRQLSWTGPSTRPGFRELLRLDCLTYLHSDMLFKVDYASMQNSIEVRVPFLDNEVIKSAFRLPADRQASFFNRKEPLRSILRKHSLIPEFDFKKRGFNIPLHDILSAPDVRSYFHQQISTFETRASKLVDLGAVKKILADESRRWKFSYELYNVLVLLSWVNRTELGGARW